MASTAKGVDPAQNPALAEIEKKNGRSNFLRTLANRPETMQKFLDFYKSVMGPGSLDRRLKEIIYVAVSTVNECAYCTSHHVKGAQAAGLSETDIHEIQTENDQHFSPKERAALHYARELTRNANVDEDTRYPVAEHFPDDEVVELTLVIGLANLTNRFNNGLDVPLDDPSA